MDEFGIRSGHHAGTAWAPEGETPVIEATGRFSNNMMSTISPGGTLRFRLVEGMVTATIFARFCEQLAADSTAHDKIFLFVEVIPRTRPSASRGH